MATSGSVTVKVTDYDNLVFTWSLVSQDIVANTSRVTWKMTLVADGASGVIVSTVKKAWTVVVDGTTYSGTATTGIGAGETKTLASGSTTIEHDADGAKTFAFSFKQVFKGLVFSGESVGDKTGSGVGNLPTIARASAPSCVTWPEHTQQVGDFGSTISIHMNRKSSSFTHTVRYKFGEQTGTIATGVGTGTTWTIPLSLMNLIPNNTSGSGMIYVDTYNGSTLVGTGSCGFTATVPSSVKPTVTLALEDETDMTDTYGAPVQGLSKIRVTATGKIAYSSPIQSYVITANGSSYTGEEITTDVLKAAGAQTFTVKVKDSRGRSGTANASLTALAYEFPQASKLVVHRCNQDGTENDLGEYVKATLSAAVTSLDGKNTATYTLKHKKTTATSWTSTVLTALANNYAPTNKSHVFAADSNSSYDLELVVTDNHGTATRSTSVSTAFTLINWGANGTSIAFGKVAEKANSMEIGLRMYDEYNTRIGNGVAAYGASGNAIDADTTMEHVFLTTVGTPTTAFWYVFQTFYNSKTETGNRAQFAIPYSVKGPIYHRFRYGENGWSAWMTSEDATDTGWLSATSLLTSKFTQHSASDPPVYRKVGKTVRLSGAVAPTATITGSETETTIYTLPAGFRPAVSCYTVCQGSGNALWLCGVTTAGAVTFSRHRDATITNKYAYASTGASEWLKFSVTFFID